VTTQRRVKRTAARTRAAWLLLAYRLPANSGLKSTVRRRLTAMGAVYPAKAIAVLPESPAAERAFRRFRSMIGEAGGSAQVLRAETIEGEPELVAAQMIAERSLHRFTHHAALGASSACPRAACRGTFCGGILITGCVPGDEGGLETGEPAARSFSAARSSAFGIVRRQRRK
jgi:hypothetical protein